MDIVPILGAGATIISVTLALVGFIMTQARSTRDAWQAADRALAEGEAKARHTLSSTLQTAVSKLEGEIDRLKREAYRREEAQQLETRLGTSLSRLEAKLDRHGEQMAQLVVLDASVKHCTEQMAQLTTRLNAQAQR